MLKLINKETGETGELFYIVSVSLNEFKQYENLVDLYKEWEAQ